MNKKKIYLPIGLPASGKTTYFNNNLKHLTGKIERICMDDIIKTSTGEFDQNKRKLYREIENTLLETAVSAYKDIYIDRTNLTQKIRARFINFPGVREKYEIIAIFFDVPLNICKERNSATYRFDKTDKEIEGINKNYSNMQSLLVEPSLDEGFDKIIIIRGEGDNVTREIIRKQNNED